jgi:hypothetical protein
VRQRDLAKNFKTTEKPPTHGVFHREASNRFLKSASVSCLNEASRLPQKESHHEFTQLVEERLKALTTEPKMRSEFIGEMRRFLPAATVRGTLENPAYWDFLNQTLRDQASLALKELK